MGHDKRIILELDVSQRGGGGGGEESIKRNVSGTLLLTQSINESSLISNC